LPRPTAHGADAVRSGAGSATATADASPARARVWPAGASASASRDRFARAASAASNAAQRAVKMESFCSSSRAFRWSANACWMASCASAGAIVSAIAVGRVVDTADSAEPAESSAEVAPTTRSTTVFLATARRRAAPLSLPPSCPLLPLMVGGRISRHFSRKRGRTLTAGEN
jgi:hypothetical protein